MSRTRPSLGPLPPSPLGTAGPAQLSLSLPANKQESARPLLSPPLPSPRCGFRDCATEGRARAALPLSPPPPPRASSSPPPLAPPSAQHHEEGGREARGGWQPPSCRGTGESRGEGARPQEARGGGW